MEKFGEEHIDTPALYTVYTLLKSIHSGSVYLPILDCTGMNLAKLVEVKVEAGTDQ